jgi:hypothetical protein
MEVSMILRARDIPPYEMHLVPIADLRQQIRSDRYARPILDSELQARQRCLAVFGEYDIDWNFALAS